MNNKDLNKIKETLMHCNSSLYEILNIIKSKIENINGIIKYIDFIILKNNNEIINNKTPNNIIRLNKLNKDAKCAKCGVFLKKDWSAYWDKVNKKFYCSKHKEG